MVPTGGFLSKFTQHVGNSGPHKMGEETRDRLTDTLSLGQQSSQDPAQTCSAWLYKAEERSNQEGQLTGFCGLEMVHSKLLTA